MQGKKFVNVFTAVYRTELLLYFILGNAVFYTGNALAMRSFNRRFMMGIMGPGMMAAGLCLYARTTKYQEYYEMIAPHYQRELKIYSKVFKDHKDKKVPLF